MPLLAVGAAFDYHAGQLRKPPPWMQRVGLEWLWRLGLEPGRLWRRYLILNPRLRRTPGGPAHGARRPTPGRPAAARAGVVPV